jgi:hypothetical protein
MVIEIDLFGKEDEDVIVVSKKQEEPQETENIEEIERYYAKQLQLQTVYDLNEKSLNIPFLFASKE